MTWLRSLLATSWARKAVLIAAVALAGAAFGAYQVHTRAKVKYAALEKTHNEFVGGVAALGAAAKAAAAKQALHELKNKERTDEENLRTHAATQRLIAGLRRAAAARDSRGGSVPAAPAGSVCPPGQTCFDTAEYQRALGDFDRETRQLADEGTAVTTDLDSAKRWATK
jgi:hypothetical protein